jgi:hypothetical protein
MKAELPRLPTGKLYKQLLMTLLKDRGSQIKANLLAAAVPGQITRGPGVASRGLRGRKASPGRRFPYGAQ